jgi:hypothetical protein
MGHAVGDVTMTAAYRQFSASFALRITAAELFNIEPSFATHLAPAMTVPLTARGLYTDQTRKDLSADLKWKSNDPSVVALDSSGQVASALKAGVTFLLADYQGQADYHGDPFEVVVEVHAAPLAEISVMPGSGEFPVGGAFPIQAVGSYGSKDAGSKANIGAQVTWSSSAPSVATVTGSHVQLVAPGVATLTATSGTISGSSTFTVRPPAITSIALTPASITLRQGSVTSFLVQGTLADGTNVDLSPATHFSSADPSVAWVTELGSGTRAGAAGTTTLTATFGAWTTTIPVTVTP